MLNESVIKVLKNGMWDLATCANGEPNVVPVAFKNFAICVGSGRSIKRLRTRLTRYSLRKTFQNSERFLKKWWNPFTEMHQMK